MAAFMGAPPLPCQDLAWPALLRFALAGRGVKAAAFAHALPEPFPLLGRHMLPAFGHAIRHAFFHTADRVAERDRKSTRLNSSHRTISYAVFCLKKKKIVNTVT